MPWFLLSNRDGDFRSTVAGIRHDAGVLPTDFLREWDDYRRNTEAEGLKLVSPPTYVGTEQERLRPLAESKFGSNAVRDSTRV
jgi:hypothetical protein